MTKNNHPAGDGSRFEKAKRSLRDRALEGLAGRVQAPPASVRSTPRDLPYVPLGIRGDFYFLLDAGKVFLPVRRRDLGATGLIISLFAGAPGSLSRLYPVMSKGTRQTPAPDSYRHKSAVSDLAALCAKEGPFNPELQIRGRGAWLDRKENGEEQLLVHFGDRLTLDGSPLELTKLNGFAYPAAGPVLPAPCEHQVTRWDASGDWLVQQFSQWHWRYPRLAPRLLTGWVAAALLNGALSHRPCLAISGAAEWGLAELFQTVRQALGGFLAVADEASEQQIADALAWDSLAVLIDPPATPATSQRHSARKPAWAVEHAPAKRFRGMRLCSASTAAVLGLASEPSYLELGLAGRPGNGRIRPSGDEYAARLLALARRIFDEFPRFRDSVLPAWCNLLRVQEGSETASVLTIGTLLSAHWVLTQDGVPNEADFEALGTELDEFMLSERAGHVPAYRQVFDCILGVVAEPFNATVLHEIAEASGYGCDGDANAFEGVTYHRTEREAIRHAENDPAARRAQRRIGQLGFRVLGNEPGQRRLAIAPSAPERERLLERTGYAQLLQRGLTVGNTVIHAPGAERHASTKWFHGLGPKHCVTVPLDLVIGGLVGNDPEGVAEAWDEASDLA